ncbi:phosphatase PAP2 family protein [Longimicrobium sp.]|uniref:phosphatase PAP2 family protein n=1 Tax=Longimicrobium sp. TaxID=2029185 RepID=UPI002E34F7F4|nr:phosphatase PAP2 family protein [Longimicrobium sp.]HEX6039568.1 phosphatase PAP2 family protein [Longimicrobium sp.]
MVSGREAAAGAGLFIGALLLDRTIESAVPDGGGRDLAGLTDALNHGGRPQYAVVLLGGTWAAGALTGRGEWSDAALHVGAGLAAGGVLNGALKYAVGRERPGETDDPHRFQPLDGRNRWQSFPSGHATVAFSVASAVAEEARTQWVTVLAYGGATAVAWSRVYDDKHWASDVAAGALIGIVAGRGAVRLLHRGGGDPPRITLAPGLMAIRVPLR